MEGAGRRCRTETGQVIHKSGKKLAYGALVPAAMKLAVPAEPTLKDPKDFRILGKRTNAWTRRPSSTAARQVRHRRAAARPAGGRDGARRSPAPSRPKIDDSKAKAVRACSRSSPSRTAWRCWPRATGRRRRPRRSIDWDLGAAKDLSTAKVSDMLASGASQADAIALDAGNVKDAAANSASTLDASYEAPHLARLHGADELHGLGARATRWRSGPARRARGPNQGILSQVASVTPAR